MHVTAYDEHEGEIEKTVNKVLTPELLAALKKKLNDELTPLFELAVNEIVEWSPDSVSRIAAERAKKFLEAVLAGDEKAANNLFGLYGFDGRKVERPVIHGSLFEAKPIELRRLLVEAHPELLRNARIADLEALLEGARQQVISLEADLNRRRQYHGETE